MLHFDLIWFGLFSECHIVTSIYLIAYLILLFFLELNIYPIEISTIAYQLICLTLKYGLCVTCVSIPRSKNRKITQYQRNKYKYMMSCFMTTMALNIYRYKTVVVFKSVTFEFLQKIKESVGDDANSVFHEDQKFFQCDTFESDTIFVTFKSVTFENFRKCSESVNFDANNDLQEDLKIFKSDTFENYKSFVPVEVQSLYSMFCQC